MRIITLIENLVYKQELIAEHGLSFYIETANKKILLDTGQSGNFLLNAKVLGIDIKDIDAVVISHGHYDHTGGLYPFLQLNNKAIVYVKETAFFPKFHGTERFIGIVYRPEKLDNRIIYVSRKTQVDEDVYIMPDIPIVNPLDTSFNHFRIKMPDGFLVDEFDDELYLVITHKSQLSVISSCSHRGISNIIKAAVNHFNLPVHTILGGFHIKNCGVEQLETITHCLEHFSVKSIGICHCTGVEKFADLVYHFKTKVFYNHTGYKIEII